MINDPDLACRKNRRRGDVRAAPLFGLDFVDVSEDQLTLEVFFLGKAPQKINVANVRIDGGSRVRDIQVTGIRLRRIQDPALDDTLEVHVNKPGDFSTYTLSLVKVDDEGHPIDQPFEGFDPRYDSVQFTFKAGCPTDLDCKRQQVCPPPQRTQPEINYLAKDYASFRQLILDRLALIMPGWRESHVPDLGIALVEVLAYVGDYLSYYQDAVATEAYLGTARQRISVRRHVRLVDYDMHEGCNARAWITVHTDTDGSLNPGDFYFTTGFSGSSDSGVFQPADLQNVTPGSYEVFEPLVEDPTQPIVIYAAHSEIHFYTWGDYRCCIAKGATSATLADRWIPKPAGGGTGSSIPPVGAGERTRPGTTPSMVVGQASGNPLARTPRPVPTPPSLGETLSSDGPPGTVRALNLRVGDVLIFEEVLGPKTGDPAAADPSHRQPVRLTKVIPAIDPLYHPSGKDYGQPIVEIEWCSEDALQFPLCLSAQAQPPDCGCLENVSVARGNVILVDNGSGTSESLGTVPIQSTREYCPTDCLPAETVVVSGTYRPTLTGSPLTFSQPLPACGCASALIVNDPRQALPQITLTGTLTTKHGDIVTTWSPKHDLLESGPNDPDFVVEMDDDGNAHLRFGDGTLGRAPDAGTNFRAAYRLGNGPDGNVGAEMIRYLVFRRTTEGMGSLVPRNPLAATGGTAPEPLEEVRMFAPYAFRTILQRAITGDDYADLAADNARRLAERPSLLAAATQSSPLPPPGASSVVDLRKSEEEEPGEPPALGADICLQPFRRLQGAKATLRWTGGWYEALVAIDPLGTEEADEELLLEIAAYLEPYRRMGHDLEVKLADYAPLDLALTICVLPNYQRAHVESALLDIFSNRILPDGRLGFFHPDNLTFGQGIYLSRIVAAAQAVSGVQEVQVTRLERYEIGEPSPGVETPGEEVPLHGVLPLGPFEIARLDNDPSVPENGRLTLDLRGGR